jgi:DNA-binding MarR family transcriptional regulator
MATVRDDAERLQDAFSGVVRALGLLRPDTTPCGQPMSTTEAHAVDELRTRGSLTQKDLASALRLQKSTVSRLVDQLEAHDLVARIPSRADQRSVQVALTANGKRRAARLVTARRALFEHMLRKLDARDRRTVVDGLSLLQELVDAST